MEKISDDVYMYMCDVISGELYRAREQMKTISMHLANHPTTARFKAQDASNVIDKITAVLNDLDDMIYQCYQIWSQDDTRK